MRNTTKREETNQPGEQQEKKINTNNIDQYCSQVKLRIVSFPPL